MLLNLARKPQSDSRMATSLVPQCGGKRVSHDAWCVGQGGRRVLGGEVLYDLIGGVEGEGSSGSVGG